MSDLRAGPVEDAVIQENAQGDGDQGRQQIYQAGSMRRPYEGSFHTVDFVTPHQSNVHDTPHRQPAQGNQGCRAFQLPSGRCVGSDCCTPTVYHSPPPCDRPNYKSSRHQIHPETYEGRSPVDQYLERFEEIADWNRWDDEERAMQLTMNLRGSAKAAVSTLSRDERRSYYSVWHVLKDSFGEKNDVLVFQEQFWQRVKGNQESLAEFSNDLKLLASRAFQGMLRRGENEAFENMLINRFVAGIGNTELGRYVHLQHPVTLNQAVQIAREFVAFDQIGKTQMSKPRSQINMVGNSENVGAVREGNVDQLSSLEVVSNLMRGLIGDVKTQIQGLVEQIKEIKTEVKMINVEVKAIKKDVSKIQGHVAKQSEEIRVLQSKGNANSGAIEELRQTLSRGRAPGNNPPFNAQMQQDVRFNQGNQGNGGYRKNAGNRPPPYQNNRAPNAPPAFQRPQSYQAPNRFPGPKAPVSNSQPSKPPHPTQNQGSSSSSNSAKQNEGNQMTSINQSILN